MPLWSSGLRSKSSLKQVSLGRLLEDMPEHIDPYQALLTCCAYNHSVLVKLILEHPLTFVSLNHQAALDDAVRIAYDSTHMETFFVLLADPRES